MATTLTPYFNSKTNKFCECMVWPDIYCLLMDCWTLLFSITSLLLWLYYIISYCKIHHVRWMKSDWTWPVKCLVKSNCIQCYSCPAISGKFSELLHGPSSQIDGVCQVWRVRAVVWRGPVWSTVTSDLWPLDHMVALKLWTVNGKLLSIRVKSWIEWAIEPLSYWAISEELSRKKKVRGGHKASATRMMSRVDELTVAEGDPDISMLNKLGMSLKEKL